MKQSGSHKIWVMVEDLALPNFELRFGQSQIIAKVPFFILGQNLVIGRRMVDHLSCFIPFRRMRLLQMNKGGNEMVIPLDKKNMIIQ